MLISEYITPVMYSEISGYAPEWIENISSWINEHKTELIIGTAFILAGILTMGGSAIIGGAGFAGVMSAMGSATLSSAINVGASMLVSGAINGLISNENGTGFWSGFTDGLASGYMWGGIVTGVAQVVKGVMSISANYIQTGRKGGYMLGRRLKIWSPNANSVNGVSVATKWRGGTLLKLQKINGTRVFALDVGGRFSLHAHLITDHHIPVIQVASGILDLIFD